MIVTDAINLTDASAAYTAAEEALKTTKEQAKEQRAIADAAFGELVDAANGAGEAAISEAAAGYIYTQDEIDKLTDDEEHGVRVLKVAVKESAKAMRVAAKSGDAAAAEAALTAAEDELGEVEGTLKDLRRALRDHRKNLLKAIDAATRF
jgi:hypothetical protein